MRRAVLLLFLPAIGCGKADFDDRYAHQSSQLDAARNAMQADLDNRMADARKADAGAAAP